MSGFYTTDEENDSTMLEEYFITTNESENPWENTPQVQKVIELLYLSIITVVGTFGNLVVIFSITLDDRVRSHGNIFVINLAIADLMVTGFVVPTMLANVVAGKNALSIGACAVVGFILTVTCTCSVANLTAIAINRYFAVVHNHSYVDKFTKKNLNITAALCWLWSSILSIPTLVGWSRISYDVKIQVCSWDDTFVYSYTIFLAIFAIFVPLVINFFCYTKLYLEVKRRGEWIRSLSSTDRRQIPRHQNKRSVQKERILLKTLATTVAFFCICWLPYASAILIDANGIPALVKKIFGWIGLSNSAINFMIYGVMNPVFRRGYRNLFFLLLRCKKQENASSTLLHTANSGTMRRKSKNLISPPSPSFNQSMKSPVHSRQSIPIINFHELSKIRSTEVISAPEKSPPMSSNLSSKDV